jgi:hypothetical protein
MAPLLNSASKIAAIKGWAQASTYRGGRARGVGG